MECVDRRPGLGRVPGQEWIHRPTPAEQASRATAGVLYLLHIRYINVVGAFLRYVASKTFFVHILHRTRYLIVLKNFKAPPSRVWIKLGIFLHQVTGLHSPKLDRPLGCADVKEFKGEH